MNYSDKIDLHIHTDFSNGKDDLISVLIQAEQNGVKIISITDYNTLISYIKLKNEINIEDYYRGQIVVGLEVRCRVLTQGKQRNCDMLVYNIDLDKIEDFQNWLEENTGKDQKIEGQIIQLEHFKKVALKMGLKIDEDLRIENEESRAGTTMINNILKYYDYNVKIWPNLERYKEVPSAAWIEVFTNPNSDFFFDISEYSPKLEDLIHISREFGGMVFAAHPFAYVTGSENLEQAKSDLITYVNDCLKQGVDGVECFNQYNCELVPFAIEATTELYKYCIINNIKICGGTDYHSKEDLRLNGIGNLGSATVKNAATYVSYGVVSNWAKPINIERNQNYSK